MAFRIAVAGKGGTGKTTLSALMIRALLERSRRPVLAVDADPNASLGLMLDLVPPKTLADIREDANRLGQNAPSGLSKPAAVEYELQAAVCEGRGVDLLTMGRPEGPGCYCYVNNMLRGFLEKLGDGYPWVVMDNEAGMEHLSRRTTNNVDLLLLVYEPTAMGITTARRLHDLSSRLPISIGRRLFVANRVPAGGLDAEVVRRVAEARVEPDLQVPADETLFRHGAAGKSVFDLPESCPALAAVRAALAGWAPDTAPDNSRRAAATLASPSR